MKLNEFDVRDWLEFDEWPLAARIAGGLVAAALALALWSVVASTIFLVGTGLMTQHHGFPIADWWLYLFFYGLDRPVIGFWLKLSGALAIGVPLLLVLVGIARKGLPGDRRALHGETEWAGNAELRENGLLAGSGGLFVGKVARSKYVRFGGPEHIACYAPTRSGKGVGLVIPNCLLYEASLVCLDVKKENFAATAGIRAKVGQKVILFDPLAPDGRTARYNPLSYVRRGTLDAFDDIQRIAGMLFPQEEGKNAFFSDSARSAFVGATTYLAETEGAELTLGTALRIFARPEAPAEIQAAIKARAAAGKPYSEPTVTALADYLSGNADTIQDIRKTVTSRLGLWFNPRIDCATSASDFDLRELRRSLHAVYVGVTPDNIVRLRPLLTLFFQQLVDLTVQVLPQFDPKAKHQVLVLLDEFPLLGPMPVLADAFAYVAGYNMRMMLVMQSKAQLRDPALYGPDKADAILDNCGIEVVFGTKSNELAQELSERLGYDTVEGVSRSGPRFWRMFRSNKLNLSESDQRRALLLPQEVLTLRKREAIVLRAGMHPAKVRRIRYFKDALFRRLEIKPPEIKQIEIVARVLPVPVQPPAPTETDATKAATEAVAEVRQVDEAADTHAIQATQCEAFFAAVSGSEVDISKFAMDDGKSFVSGVLGDLSTKKNRRRKAA
jgi:type IV secretion system protein VirD4